MNILIDYSNYILNNNNQLDVIFYKSDEAIAVQCTCTWDQCKYRQLKTFDTIAEGRQYFAELTNTIISDESINSFGTINKQWYQQWDWIKIDSNGRPITYHLQTIEFECGTVHYKFRFNDDGSIDPNTVIIDRRFLLDSTAVPLIAELASLKYQYQVQGFIEKMFRDRQIRKICKLLRGHVKRVFKVGTKIVDSRPMKDCDLIVNAVVNDILTYDSLELMFLQTSVLINPNFSSKIH